MLLGWSTRLIADGGMSTLADSGDVPQKGTAKLLSLGLLLFDSYLPDDLEILTELQRCSLELEICLNYPLVGEWPATGFR
jgi:hypothetical protein